MVGPAAAAGGAGAGGRGGRGQGGGGADGARRAVLARADQPRWYHCSLFCFAALIAISRRSSCTGPENFTYSQQPSALRAARDTLATAILSVQKKLDGGGQALRDRAQQHRQAEAWLKNATTQIMSECRIQSTNPNTSDWMMFSPNAKKHYRGQW